jgi:hypothetical protein
LYLRGSFVTTGNDINTPNGTVGRTIPEKREKESSVK